MTGGPAPRESRAQRYFDIIIALVALILLFPLCAAIALVVRLSSRGPAIFRQTRVGRAGREFRILKFRTMIVDSPSGGPLVTVTRDPRITTVGAFLRKTKLDELPQLVNVLRGEMSIVGPRPEVPKYVALYPRDACIAVLAVRPGMTDYSSIVLRDEQGLLAMEEDPERYYCDHLIPYKLALGAHYARTRTLAQDVRLILLTLVAIVAPDSAPLQHLRASVAHFDHYLT
jgi:lipopolysaccharide/colanic/teichoic acid biosynthesis glycosyltransferase